MPGVNAFAPPRSDSAVRRVPQAVMPGGSGSQLRSKDRYAKKAEPWSEEELTESIANQAKRSLELATESNTAVGWLRAMQSAQILGDKGAVTRAAIAALDSLRTAPPRPADPALVDLAGSALLGMGNEDQLASALDRVEEARPELARVGLRAALLARRGDLPAALEELVELGDGGTLSLRAYLELELGKPTAAISGLRRLIKEGQATPPDHMNLALAFWRVGSYRKAVRSAREASRMAPGRKDISLDSLRLLLAFGDVEAVQSDVTRLKAKGVDDPDLVRLEADVFDAQGDLSRALRSIERLIRREGVEKELLQESEAFRAVLQARLGSLDRRTALSLVLECVADLGPNPVLVDWLVELADSKEDAAKVRPHFESVRSQFVDNYRIRLESQLAYLDHDWAQSLALAETLLVAEPSNEFAIGVVGMLTGHLQEDWDRAAGLADRMRRRGQIRSQYMFNQAAFFLASAGRGADALNVLADAPSLDHIMIATRGLAKMADCDFQGGARDYREAFAAIPPGPRQQTLRVLMAIFQAQAVHRLGIADREDRIAVVGSVLPISDLRDLEESDSNFALLKACAEKNGWDWPTLF